MRSVVASLLLLAAVASVASAQQPCRFARQYSTQDIARNSKVREAFLDDVIAAESRFHSAGLGYHAQSGMTYDGARIGTASGSVLPDGLHQFSAPSKESLHLALLSRAVAGDVRAQRWAGGKQRAIDLLRRKARSYEVFNLKYPGFAGFLPWFRVTPESDGVPQLLPGWESRVPALDNGEWIWTVLAADVALRDAQQYDVAAMYQAIWERAGRHAVTVFAEGHSGLLRAVASIKDVTKPPSRQQYACDPQRCYYLDDPYEGELFAWFAYMYADWDSDGMHTQRAMLWEAKKAKHRAAMLMTSQGPITVQEGHWFSSHEAWKWLMMPYAQSPRALRIFRNGERARTHFSADQRVPGLYASVTGPARHDQDQVDYLSACGIQAIATETVQHRMTVTPYAAYPVVLADPVHGLAWYHAMLLGPRAQNPFGSTEACQTDGSAVSPFVTWDAKATTVLAALGGIGNDLVTQVLRRDGHYAEFIKRVDNEVLRVFGDGPYLGEHLDFAMPTAGFPTDRSAYNFTSCT